MSHPGTLSTFLFKAMFFFEEWVCGFHLFSCLGSPESRLRERVWSYVWTQGEGLRGTDWEAEERELIGRHLHCLGIKQGMRRRHPSREAVGWEAGLCLQEFKIPSVGNLHRALRWDRDGSDPESMSNLTNFWVGMYSCSVCTLPRISWLREQVRAGL